MHRVSPGLLFSCFLLAFFQGFSSSASCAETGIQSPLPGSRVELERLAEISRRLASLNETLSRELLDSRRSSAELALSLENSKLELFALKSELEGLREISNSLAQSAERSETESRELRTALTKAESSLRNSEASFEAFRKESVRRIAGLERAAARARFFTAAVSVIALGGWGAFLVMLL